jgi:hypothetical protein
MYGGRHIGSVLIHLLFTTAIFKMDQHKNSDIREVLQVDKYGGRYM